MHHEKIPFLSTEDTTSISLNLKRRKSKLAFGNLFHTCSKPQLPGNRQQEGQRASRWATLHAIHVCHPQTRNVCSQHSPHSTMTAPCIISTRSSEEEKHQRILGPSRSLLPYGLCQNASLPWVSAGTGKICLGKLATAYQDFVIYHLRRNFSELNKVPPRNSLC